MQKLKLLLITLVLSFAVLMASVEGWSFYRFVSQPIANFKDSKVISIPSGSTAQKVASLLYDQQLIRSETWFLWVLKYQDKAHLLKAGEFEINPNWTIDELIQGLIEGKTIQYPVTFIAGKRAKETVQGLKKLPNLKHTLTHYNEKEIREKLNIQSALEGQFLPETYHYQSGEKDIDLLQRAHKAMRAVLEEAWSNRQKDLPLKSPYEALILASIVEKETGYAPERPLIAGVFMNRLRKGMRLQSDPTIIYGMGDSYDGNIRKKDIQTKTAYNTYRINRLPPTPIALASADAIRAVCQPASTKALYFVAKGGGQHAFSNTLKEHNRAVRKYLLNK